MRKIIVRGIYELGTSKKTYCLNKVNSNNAIKPPGQKIMVHTKNSAKKPIQKITQN